MSVMGLRSGPKADVRVESDLPPITDAGRAPGHVAEVPNREELSLSVFLVQRERPRHCGDGERILGTLRKTETKTAIPLKRTSSGSNFGSETAMDDKQASDSLDRQNDNRMKQRAAAHIAGE